MSREFVQKTLIDMERHHFSEREIANTTENPSVLRGYYNVEIVWDDFWRCFEEVCVATNVEAVERYGSFSVNPSDIIRKAVDLYHQTERFVKALTAIKDAKKAKEDAVKAEELRLRNDVPAITKMYDELLAEKKALEKKLSSYERFHKALCDKAREAEQTAYEAKWCPKYFKETMATLKEFGNAEWTGKTLVVKSRGYTSSF